MTNLMDPEECGRLLSEQGKKWAEDLLGAEERAHGAITAAIAAERKWQSIATAPRDGTEVILLTSTGAVSAHYDKGAGWSDDPINGRDYEGPSWVCYDNTFLIEIEETPDGECCEVLGWMPIPDATTS